MEPAMKYSLNSASNAAFVSQNKKLKGVAVILLAGLAMATVGCKPKSEAKEQAQAAAMPAPVVMVANAKAQNVPLYISSIGKAIATESVTITPRISGQVVEKCFEDGAMIKQGQILFKLDRIPFEAALASAQAQLAQSEASLDFANIELARYETIAGTNAVSKTDYDTKKNAVKVAEAQVAAAQAAVRTSKIRLDYCTIEAPIAGRAGARLVDVGNIVKENDTAMLSIQKLSPIYAQFTINEQQLAQVRQYMSEHSLKAFVKLPGDQGDGVEGDLTFLNNAVEQATGTVRLRATLSNKDMHFWSGQFVNVKLVLKTLDDAVLVPQAAVQLSQKGQYVLSVDEQSNAQFRPVKTGQSHDQWVVVDGVKAGERVIVDGQLMVRPGGPVNVPQAAQNTEIKSAAQPEKTKTANAS
jgi:multidrug efflux system membrane fusion protein